MPNHPHDPPKQTHHVGLPRRKPKSLVKGSSDLAFHIVAAALALTCEEAPSPESGGDVETPLSIAAAQLLDTAAFQLPSKHVYPLVSKWVGEAWGSGSVDRRRGALLSAGYISEGCDTTMGKEVKNWMGIVVEGL